MKCLSKLFFSICIFILAITTVAFGDEKNCEISGIQFDALIELAPPSIHEYVCLFVRYWVAPDRYKLTILWAEPDSYKMWFPIYPPTLKIVSDTTSFSVQHQFFTRYNSQDKRPFVYPKIFKYMYGDYLINNLKYTDQYANQTQVFLSDLKLEGNNQKNGTFKTTINDTNRLIGLVENTCTNGVLQSLWINDKSNHPLQELHYKYDSNNSNQLLAQYIKLAERETTVGFTKGNMQVEINSSNYAITQFPATYLDGGRNVTIKYEQIRLGNRSLVLPSYVESHISGQSAFVSRIIFTNYLPFVFTNSLTKFDDLAVGDFSYEEVEARRILSEWGNYNFTNIPSTEVSNIKAIILALSKPGNDSSCGSECKRLSFLISLYRIIGSTDLMIQSYKELLNQFRCCNSYELVLNGGYDHFESMLIFEHFSDADLIFNFWLDECKLIPRDYKLAFALDEISKKHYYAAYLLLKKSVSNAINDEQFEFKKSASCYFALLSLNHLLEEKSSPQDILSKAHFTWTLKQMSPHLLKALLLEQKNDYEALRKKISKTDLLEKKLINQIEQCQAK